MLLFPLSSKTEIPWLATIFGFSTFTISPAYKNAEKQEPTTIKNSAQRMVVMVIAVLFLFIKKSPSKAIVTKEEDFIHQETPTARISFDLRYSTVKTKINPTKIARKTTIPAGVRKNIITCPSALMTATRFPITSE